MTNSVSPVKQLLRNPFRTLNHLDLINGKINIGKKWSLIWNSNVVDDTKTDDVKDVILGLQKGAIHIKEALLQIQTIHGNQNGNIIKDLLQCYPTGLLEFHPTDVCDLSCKECHYRNKENATIPFSEIKRLVSNLAPKAITVTGGGEPNVYKSETYNLNNLIIELKHILPNTELGLINNNTHIPEGEWVNYIAWQRTSIDASSRETYLYLKGVDKFEKAIQNVKAFLYHTNIPFVGIGFLYRKENVGEIEDFLVSWFYWFKNEAEAIQKRFNIQFRPISPAIESVEKIRKGEDVFLGEEIEHIVNKEVDNVLSRSENDSTFKKFLMENTNFNSLITDRKNGTSYFVHTPKPFKNCYNTLIHRILRANGDEYPDFLLCNFPELYLGNTLLNPNDEERIKISLMQFYYFNRVCSFCNEEICRQGWVSKMVEDYFTGQIKEAQINNIPRHYFF